VKRVDYPPALKALVAELKRMPGVGPRSAERIALWMVQKPEARPQEIGQAIAEVTAQIHPCRDCGFFAEGELCEICADTSRETSQLCVVENATDILPIERTGVFRGKYHALGGRISPLEHIGPEHLRIDALLQRIQRDQPGEVILALASDVEGEATASYVASLLRGASVSVTRIAQGLPAGGGLEFADELTVARAMSGRRAVQDR
jgi:recombination protein RecR